MRFSAYYYRRSHNKYTNKISSTITSKYFWLRYITDKNSVGNKLDYRGGICFTKCTLSIWYVKRYYSPIVLGGDFNAKHRSWNNFSSNTRGVQLYKYIQDNDISLIHTSKPTQLSLADFFVTWYTYTTLKNIW